MQLRMVTLGLLLMNLAGAPVSRTIYFSKIQKDAVSQFLFRLAAKNFQYVVTNEPIPTAIASQKVEIKTHERAVVIEQDKNGCIDMYCLVAVSGDPESQPAHVFHSYYDVGTETITPGVQTKNNWSYKYQSSFLPMVISQDEMREHDAVLSGEKPISADGATIKERKKEASKKLAREYIKSEYEKLGYQVREVPFDHNGYSGINLVAEKKGKDNRFAIVSAHYDTVSSPGADDDASGVVTSLALAKALANADLKHSIQFVAFDFEEVGLVGSQSYAKQLEKSGQINDVLGVFQVEMTGYNPKGNSAIHIIDCNENTSSDLSKLVESAISQQSLGLKKVDACTDRSDHASFWAYNRPAIVVSENFFGGEGNPCYHRACDVNSKLDFKYMAEIAQALLGAVSSVVLN